MKKLLLLLAVLLSPTTLHADGGSVAQACAGIAKADARLACYDKAFPPIDVAHATVGVKPEAEFGLSQHQLSARNPDSPSISQIVANIIAIRADSRGKRIVTLDNGQVWAILEVPSKGFLKVGDQTSVRKATLGTFMLLSPSGIALRARRID